MISFEVLGPVRARDGAWRADLPPQQRLLLAILVMAAGQPVQRGQLVNLLWDEPDGPPEGALRRVVSGLRTELSRAAPAGNPLPALGDTYCLPLAEQQADVLRFRAKADAARRVSGLEGTGLRAEALAEWGGNATGLFGGQPLAGLRGRWADSTREKLRAEYRDIRYQSLWGEFENHRYDQVSWECRQLATEPHALADEKFLELWMVAAYRAGHRPEVQQIYERAVISADADLGVKLSGRLHELARIIRNEDPRLDGPGDLLERVSISLSQGSSNQEATLSDVEVHFHNHDNTQVGNQTGKATGPITINMGAHPGPVSASSESAPDPEEDDEPRA